MSSGLHSSIYLQSAIVLSYPEHLIYIAKDLVRLIKNTISLNEIDLVVSPAMGGVIIGSKVGEILNKQSIFLERVNSKLVFRRGFTVEKKSKVIVVEDVVTTGKSSQECIDSILKLNAKVLGVFSIINRSIENIKYKIPRYSLLSLNAPLYEDNNLPVSLKNIPVNKPGSRFLK